MKHVAIIIVHFNGLSDTLACLESLEQLKKHSFTLSIIVIDNYSKEPLFIQSNSYTNKIEILRNDKNLGFAGGNNVGIKKAIDQGADYILLLNSDTLVKEDFLEKLVRVFNSKEQVGIVVPKIYFAKGFEFHKKRYKESELGKVIWYAGGNIDWKNVIGHHKGVDEVDCGNYNALEQTEYATGCCMLVKREVFQKVGFLDERYFLYYEDSDLSIRARRKGFSIIYVPQAVIWHKNASAAGGSGSMLQDYYTTRNRLLFGMKYAPFKSKIALLKESFSLIIRGRAWQRRGVVDYFLGHFYKGSFPI